MGEQMSAHASPLPSSHTKRVSIQRLAVWVPVFAILSLIFLTLLYYIKDPFPYYPLISNQDVFDLLTPLLLIPVYGILFWLASAEKPRLAEWLVFLALVAFWVEGQAIHLAANSISNLMESFAKSGLFSLEGNDLYTLTYFLDEHLGHILWHAAIFGLAGLLVYHEWGSPAGEATSWWPTIVSGVIYGFTLFVMTVEGQTPLMALLFSIGIVLFAVIWGRGKIKQRPVLAFFLSSGVVTLILYGVWLLMWGSFIEITKTGIL